MIIIGLFAASASNAQEINTYLSRQEVLVGQPDTLTVKIISPTEQAVLPVFNDTLSSNIEVLFVGKVDSAVNQTGFEFTQQVYITSFDTGQFIIPAIAFQTKDSVIFSSPSLMTVVSVTVDLAKNIHGIQDIEDAPITAKEIFVVVGKVLFIVLVILLIVWVVKTLCVKYKLNKDNEVFLEPEIPFMDTFWVSLTKIEEEKFWQKGEVKEFHSQVTNLMRAYLEYRFGISALEQTTDEILTQLNVLVSDKILYAKIEQTLRFADMVKFAKATGVQVQHEKAIENLKELVQLTELKPTETSEQ